MNVVFPAPLIPTTSMTVGPDGATLSAGSLVPVRRAVAMPSRSTWRNSSWVLIFPLLASPSTSDTSRIVTGTPKSDSSSSSSSFSSDPGLTPPRTSTPTSMRAMSLMRRQSVRRGRSSLRRRMRMTNAESRVSSPQPLPQATHAAQDPLRAQQCESEQVRPPVFPEARTRARLGRAAHRAACHPGCARQQLARRIDHEHRRASVDPDVVDARGQRIAFGNIGIPGEAEPYRIRASRTTPFEPDNHHGVRAGPTVPANRLAGTHHALRGKGCAQIGAFGSEPVKYTAPHGRERVGARAAAELPAPETGRTHDHDAATRRGAHDDRLSLEFTCTRDEQSAPLA